MYFRSDFQCDNLMINISDKISLTFGTSPSLLSFDLYEASIDDRKIELQLLILWMADDIVHLNEKLKGTYEVLLHGAICNQGRIQDFFRGGCTRGGGGAPLVWSYVWYETSTCFMIVWAEGGCAPVSHCVFAFFILVQSPVTGTLITNIDLSNTQAQPIFLLIPLS